MRRILVGVVIALVALIAAPAGAQATTLAAASAAPSTQNTASTTASTAAQTAQSDGSAAAATPDQGVYEAGAAGMPRAAAPPDDNECSGNNCPATVSQLITIDRWKGATSGFDQNVGLTDSGALLDLANRKVVQGMWMSAGNMSWDWALNIVTWAGGSQGMYQGLAYAIDSVVEGLLKAFTNVGGLNLLAITMVVSTILCVLQIIKQNRGAGAQMFRRLLSVSVLMAYLTFAAASITGAGAPSKQAKPAYDVTENTQTSYKPAAGTPSWIVSKVNQGVDRVADIPSSIAMKVTDNPMGTKNRGGVLDCHNVTSAFEQELKDVDRTTKMRVMIDRTWQMTGLTTWINAQFGSGNHIGDDAYCYLLDMRSSDLTTMQRMEAAQMAADYAGKPNYPSWAISRSTDKLSLANTATKDHAMFSPQSNEQKYSAILAHAACMWDGSKFTFRGGFSVEGTTSADNPGFNPNEGQDSGPVGDTARITGGGYKWGFAHGDAQNACTAAFTATKSANWWEGDNGDAGTNWSKAGISSVDGEYLKGFIMPGNEASIDYKVSGARTKDFVSSFYGTSSGNATPIVFMFSVLSWVATIPFIALAVAVVLMRVIMTFLLLGLWVALIAAIFSPNPWEDKLKKPAMKVLTTGVMTSGLAALLGIVVTVSTTLTQVMRGVLGVTGGGTAATTMSVIIACVSPAVTILAMNYIWKKTFDAPSPMTLKGGKAWMQGAPMGMNALAAGASAGIGGYVGSRLGRAAKTVGKRGLENLTDSMLGRDGRSPGRSGRRSGMGGGGRKAASEQMTEQQSFANDLNEAKQEEAKKQVGEVVTQTRSKLASGGKAFGQSTASAWRKGRTNLRLAATPEGRELLINNAAERSKTVWRTAVNAASRLPESALTSVGLDSSTRQRIAFEAQSNGYGSPRKLGMLGNAAVAHVGGAAGRGIKEAAKLGITHTGGAAHRAIMGAAGPGATVGEAYARLAKQTALVGASVAVPAIAPVALGGIALSSTVKSAKSFRHNRVEKKQMANQKLVQGLRERREAQEEAVVAQKEAAEQQQITAIDRVVRQQQARQAAQQIDLATEALTKGTPKNDGGFGTN